MWLQSLFVDTSRLLEGLEPESWWQRVFCVNTGGQQLGFIAEIKDYSGQTQHRDLWVHLSEIAEHPTALHTSETESKGECHFSQLIIMGAGMTHQNDE